ncbi:MAG TPA: hypothetical protein VMF14_07020 [Solirubrobacteraceae bacterium]|nr:hypothetical protein [Solirubrobacteraceae bacterium]
MDQGSLPALRVGRRVRIKRSDFERILEDSYSAGTPPPSRRIGPSADDFWGGEPVGVAEPAPGVAEPALDGTAGAPAAGVVTASAVAGPSDGSEVPGPGDPEVRNEDQGGG